jgi:N-acetylmuramoyl-L-alanine amidase
LRLIIAASLVGVALLGGYRAARADSFQSQKDIRVMALNMYHEARGEGRLGMLAVGWVVLNRMADRSYLPRPTVERDTS